MKLFMALGLTAVALTLAACGSSSSSSSTASSTQPPASSSAPASSSTPASTSTSSATSSSSGGGVKVSMKNLAFTPPAIHAKVGQTVVWTNEDTPPHNVTYVSGPKFTSSSTMTPGAKFSVKLTQAGTIHYFCSIHPFMKAVIVVTP